MSATLADALRQFGPAYLADHLLSTAQAKAWRAIVACRTPALGGQLFACDACPHRHWQYHSRRHRCCPQCGARAKEAWLQGRLAEVLPRCRTRIWCSPCRTVSMACMARTRAASSTPCLPARRKLLAEFAASDQWMGSAHGTAAFSLVLHTWTQDLATHLHLHAVMACGVLAKDGQWSAPARQPGFLFPVHALSRVFRGKFMAALAGARKAGHLERERDPQGPDWRQRHRQLYRHDWVVYAKDTLGRAGAGAGLLEPLHAPHGHQQ